GFDCAEELVLREKQRLRRQYGIGKVAFQDRMATARVLPEFLDGASEAGIDTNRRARRQVIGDARGVLEEKRQVILDARSRDAFRDVLVDAGSRRIAFERLAETAAKSRL